MKDAADNSEKSIASHVVDEIFYDDGDAPRSFLDRARIFLHLLFCQHCSDEARKIESLRDVMHTDFFPRKSDIPDAIMSKIAAEEELSRDFEESLSRGRGRISTRSWVFIGCFLLISLITVFFGLDFINAADAEGGYFLLSIGLTIGLILTGYIAVFAGSHLKELSSKFNLQ